MKEFCKCNLKERMIVEVRQGYKFLVFADKLIGFSRRIPLTHYKEDLTHTNNLKDWDIMKVSKLISGDVLDGAISLGELTIWERVEFIEYRLGMEDGFDTIGEAIINGYSVSTHNQPKCASFKGIPYLKLMRARNIYMKAIVFYLKEVTKNYIEK